MTTKGRPPKAQGETLARLSKRIKQLEISHQRVGNIIVGLENELVGDKHAERIKSLEDLNRATKLVINTFDFELDKRITALEEHIKYIINDVVDMFDKLKSPRIMKIEEVEELTTLKRLTIWREEKQGRFPKHRQLTNKSIGWIASEIEEWIATHTSIPGSCNLHKESKNEES